MHQVREYFSRAIVLFKDDLPFMVAFENLLRDALPLDLRHKLIAIYTDEVEDIVKISKDRQSRLPTRFSDNQGDTS